MFGKHGLVQESPLGEKFDPNKHDALFQIPAPDQEPNTVLDVQKVGLTQEMEMEWRKSYGKLESGDTEFSPGGVHPTGPHHPASRGGGVQKVIEGGLHHLL